MCHMISLKLPNELWANPSQLERFTLASSHHFPESRMLPKPLTQLGANGNVEPLTQRSLTEEDEVFLNISQALKVNWSPGVCHQNSRVPLQWQAHRSEMGTFLRLILQGQHVRADQVPEVVVFRLAHSGSTLRLKSVDLSSPCHPLTKDQGAAHSRSTGLSLQRLGLRGEDSKESLSHRAEFSPGAGLYYWEWPLAPLQCKSVQLSAFSFLQKLWSVIAGCYKTNIRKIPNTGFIAKNKLC